MNTAYSEEANPWDCIRYNLTQPPRTLAVQVGSAAYL